MTAAAETEELVRHKFAEVWAKEIIRKSRCAVPCPHPRAFVLGGQPGAGKSNLIRLARKELDGNVVVINGDDFRKYHPAYALFQQFSALTMPQKTAAFAGAMTEAVLRRAMSEQYNIVVEGTFRTADTPIRTLKNLMENGYEREVLIQICDKRLSWESCVQRYHEALAVNPGEARYTEQSHHDGVVRGLARNIRTVQASGLADNLRIFTRDRHNAMTLIYDQSRAAAPVDRHIIDAVLGTDGPADGTGGA